MRYYAYKQIYNWINTKATETPTILKSAFYLSISIAMLSVSAIILLICISLTKSILGF